MNNKDLFRQMYNEKFNIEENRNIILNKKNKSNYKIVLLPVFIVVIVLVLLLNLNLYRSEQLKGNINNDKIIINNIEVSNNIDDIDGRWIDRTVVELLNEYPFLNNIFINENISNLRIGEMYGSSNINSENYNKLLGYDIIYTYKSEFSVVDIFFSKNNKVRQRCFGVINLDELNDSKINDVNVKIIIDDYYSYAFFEYNGLYFDIECRNINEQDLIKLIKNILKVD